MKKILSFFLCVAVLCSLAVIPSNAAADKLMIFDADHDGGVHVEESFGQLMGMDGEFKKQGTKSIAASCVYDDSDPAKGIKFAYSCSEDAEANVMGTEFDVTAKAKQEQNREYKGAVCDVSSFKYIEFDLYFYNDWDDRPFKCELQFALCATLAAQHGYNWEPGEMYFENNKWYHFRMPLSEFIVRSPQNRDLYDTEHNIGYDAPRYAADLTRVHRIKLMLTYITDLDDEPIDQTYFMLDNVVATKDNTTEGKTDAMTLEEYYEWLDSSSVAPPVSSTPVVSSQVTPPSSAVAPEYTLGDVNEDGDITSADALDALQFGVDKKSLTEAQKLAANVDAVGSVTSADALLILQYAVKKINSFPADK